MKIRLIIFCCSAGLIIAGCGGVRRDPGRVYVPDMGPSRAYETYDALDSDKFTSDVKEIGRKIFYNHMPVAGTMARGEEPPFPYAKDAAGDTANYVASKQATNPITLDSVNLKEAERLYLINCGICHGAKLDGNGPLYNGGNGPYAAKPATFVGDPKYEAMPEGQMFYSATYGKNLMGSYASQLTKTQRWEVIAYIKSKQAAAATAANASAATGTSDSSSAVTK
jgi:mono/diheme cytochrome c family protein